MVALALGLGAVGSGYIAYRVERAAHDTGCSFSDDRQESPYGDWYGLDQHSIRELAGRQGLIVAFRHHATYARVETGTILKISRCTTGRPADVVVFLARSR